MHSLIPLSLVISLSFQVNALSFPFQVRTDVAPSTRLARRANTTIPVINRGNAQYITNVTLGGESIRVLLDTGSSDLWVHFAGNTPQTKDMGKSLTLSYAIGAAKGGIRSADLKFDNYNIKDQAFLLVSDSKSFSSDIHKQGYDGLMGLGPNKGSKIYDEIDEDTANTVLTRIFEQNKTSDNFITFLLDRKGDPTNDFTGQLTVSEVIPGLENITSMPKLDIDKVHRILAEDQHWQALTDPNNGLIGPDGQVIPFKSIVPKVDEGQMIAVFDSGFTFTQVPREVSDLIYGRVQGAVYDSKNEWWTVPCGQMLNLTFHFGGKAYPIHPLDTVDDSFGIMDSTGKRVCIGTFQPITSAFSLLGHYDMILGMSFLRNVYTLMDFGNWIKGSDSQDKPYMQLLPLTDPAVAHNDFVQVRLGGEDTTGDAKWNLLPKEQMQHSPVSEEEKKKKYQEMVLSRWPYILVGCLAFVLLVVGCVVWKCCCRRGKAGKAGKKGLFGKLGKNESTPYLPVQDPGYKQASPAPYGGGGYGYHGQ